MDSDFVRVSASESVPQTILASQDNGEIEQEIVDLNAVANSVSAEFSYNGFEKSLRIVSDFLTELVKECREHCERIVV